MLNRRTLRVKALQALFSYEQCKEANYNVGLETLKGMFEPDLNSMEAQDKELLSLQGKQAIGLFEEFHHGSSRKKKFSDDKVVNEAVTSQIEKYKKEVDNDFKRIRKDIVNEADGIYDTFIGMLNLLIRFGEFAKEGVGTRKSEQEAQVNFFNNHIIETLRVDKNLESLTLKKNLSWAKEHDLVRGWFRDIVTKDEKYKEYLTLDAPDKTQDYDIVNHIVRRSIFKHDSITSYWENRDLNWVENSEITRSLVNKTIKSIFEEGEKYVLATLSYNWDEDREFFLKLYDQTIKTEDFLKDLVTQKTKNWEFDRIAFTDRLILMLAVAEMITFTNIPVKVSINEYIELSKNYSTPKSKQFVNGVLDVIAVDLQGQGLIKKSGRGLIDNR